MMWGSWNDLEGLPHFFCQGNDVYRLKSRMGSLSMCDILLATQGVRDTQQHQTKTVSNMAVTIHPCGFYGSIPL